jgi:hypothetical protein
MEKYTEFINECVKELEAKNMNNYYRISLSDKMSNIMKKLDEVTKKKCPEQVERVQSLIKMNNLDGKAQAVPIEGKEAEAQRAVHDLMQCQGQLSQMLVGIQGISNITETIVIDQLELCVNDCININNEDEAKKCIKTCYKNTYDYTLTASHKFVEKTLEGIEEQINKL